MITRKVDGIFSFQIETTVRYSHLWGPHLRLGRRVSSRVRLESWEFPGWGSHFSMTAPPGLAVTHAAKVHGWGSGRSLLMYVAMSCSASREKIVTRKHVWTCPVLPFCVGAQAETKCGWIRGNYLQQRDTTDSVGLSTIIRSPLLFPLVVGIFPTFFATRWHYLVSSYNDSVSNAWPRYIQYPTTSYPCAPFHPALRKQRKCQWYHPHPERLHIIWVSFISSILDVGRHLSVYVGTPAGACRRKATRELFLFVFISILHFYPAVIPSFLLQEELGVPLPSSILIVEFCLLTK